MKIIFQIVLIGLLLLGLSCKKPTDALDSSIKVLGTHNEARDLKMAKSVSGNILVVKSAGKGDPTFAPRQEFTLIQPDGETLRSFALSDTIFQFVDIISGIEDGYFVVAANSNQHYVQWYKLDENGYVQWAGSREMIASGYPLYAPAATQSTAGEYLVLYFNSGSGYYILKIPSNGALETRKKVPPPNAIHQNIGLNFGESVVDIVQPNDSTILLQGELYDQFSGITITNCFVRALNNNLEHKWFSNNFDSTKFDVGAGLFINQDKEVLFFGAKSDNAFFEGYGDVFIRKYNLAGQGQLIDEVLLPRVNGTPTILKKTIPAVGGGYLLIGSNNQYPANDLVSPNNIILAKVAANLTLEWTKEIPTVFPGRGFDISYLNDGSIGIVAFHKEDYSTNRVMYMHLDAYGNVIP